MIHLFVLCLVLVGSPVQALSANPKRLTVTKAPWMAEICRGQAELVTGNYWGSDGRDGKTSLLVKSINIRRGKTKIYVPASAWTDLTNVNIARLSVSRRTVTLRLQGSDGGESYVAKLFIVGDAVVAREVRSSEFGKECWERTTYHYIPDDNR